MIKHTQPERPAPRIARRIGATRSSALVLASMLIACNPMDVLEKSAPAKPATDETVIGTWRNTEPVNIEGKMVKMTLRIDDDHSMIWAQRISTNSPPDTEFSRETWDWTVVGGELVSTKTHCEYAYPPVYKLEQGDCKAPLERRTPIKVNGRAWTINEGDKPMVFRKDV